MADVPWLGAARGALVKLLDHAAEVGACVPTTATDPGPDPKAIEALGKLISAVSDVVSSGEVLEKGGGSDE